MSAGQVTQGVRLWHVDPETHLPRGSVKGDYWKDDGVWYGWCPADGERNLLCTLARHTVTEHDDGTITVSPSILCGNPGRQWHGFLEHGVWRKA
jgi:hypothetical protein